MAKTITFSANVELAIDVGPSGIVSGILTFFGSNGSRERVTIGPAAGGFQIPANTLGTAQDRAGFANVVNAAIAAGRVIIGDV